jgi:hypothetical protein
MNYEMYILCARFTHLLVPAWQVLLENYTGSQRPEHAGLDAVRVSTAINVSILCTCVVGQCAKNCSGMQTTSRRRA